MKNLKNKMFGLFLFIITSSNISFAQTYSSGVTEDWVYNLEHAIVEENIETTNIQEATKLENTIDNKENKPVVIFLLLRIIILILSYTISQSLGKKTFFHKLFSCLDSNITLLLVPLLALFWFLRTQSPIEYGAARGYGALRGLWLLLISRPLLNIIQKAKFKKTILTKFLIWFVCRRKQFGILMFWFAAIHTFIYLNDWYTYNTLRSNSLTYVGISGFLGLLTSFAGYITSNKRSLKNLKSYRKPIQKTAYIGLIASVIHVYFITPQKGIIFGILTLIWIVLRFLAKRK